jgi:enterochelin esterase-like enzyme
LKPASGFFKTIPDDLEFLKSFKDMNAKEVIPLEDKLIMIGENVLYQYLENAFQKSAEPRIGRYLDFEYVKKLNFSKAIALFNYNKRAEPYRYEARMDLFHLYRKKKDIVNSLKMAREISNLPVKIPSDKVKTYKNNVRKYMNTYQERNIDLSYHGIFSHGLGFKSTALNKKLSYKVYQPPLHKTTKKVPVLYINDGQSYLKKGNLAKKVDSLIHCNKIDPIALVFIEPRDLNKPEEKWWEIRQDLYFCNDSYTDFLTIEFFPFIEKKYAVSQEHRSILGMSFGGLSAAYIAVKNPNTFENVILQSPAFHPRKQIYTLYSQLPKQDFNVYLSYGTGKDTQKQDEPFIKILKEKGYNLYVEKVEGGNHSWKIWQPQLNEILIKYYSIEKK